MEIDQTEELSLKKSKSPSKTSNNDLTTPAVILVSESERLVAITVENVCENEFGASLDGFETPNNKTTTPLLFECDNPNHGNKLQIDTSFSSSRSTSQQHSSFLQPLTPVNKAKPPVGLSVMAEVAKKIAKKYENAVNLFELKS